jgi:hypothetical protein
MSEAKQKPYLEEILRFAALAPSPLNTRPWQCSALSPSRVEIFIDPNRTLRSLDPKYRQVMISMGAFLENLDLAARQAGFSTDVVYFPSGWPEPELDLQVPVARIELLSDNKVRRDPLFAHITDRWTDRTVFKTKEIDSRKFDILSGSFDVGPAPISLGYTTNRDLKKEIAGYLIDAMECELNNEARFSETLAWLRFPSKGASDSHTGLTLDQAGLSQVSRIYTRFMMSLLHHQSRDRFLKHTLLKLSTQQARSSGAFGWITSRENHRITQIRAGRMFERVHLSAALTGLSLQPMTQIIRDYEDMQDLQKSFLGLLGIPETHTIQMLFRLGYPRRKHAPRQIPETTKHG